MGWFNHQLDPDVSEDVFWFAQVFFGTSLVGYLCSLCGGLPRVSCGSQGRVNLVCLFSSLGVGGFTTLMLFEVVQPRVHHSHLVRVREKINPED